MSVRSGFVRMLRCLPCEQWLPVVGWETTYEVSDLGRVRSVARTGVHGREKAHYFPSRVLKQIASTAGGYLVVNLTDNADPTKPRRRIQLPVHKAVLEAFVGPRPPGMQACHGDGDRRNAALANLRWDTASANAADRTKHGTSTAGRPRTLLTPDLVRYVRTSEKSIRGLARELGRSENCVANCRKGIYYREVV
jgi:hypothetical protein